MMWILRIAFERAPTTPLEFYYEDEAACREQYDAIWQYDAIGALKPMATITDAHGRTAMIRTDGIQHLTVVDFRAELQGRIELGLAQTRAQEAFKAKAEAGMLIRARPAELVRA